MHPLDDTIAAVASPPGSAARGIVRLGGPEALDILLRYFDPPPSAFCTPPHPMVLSGALRLPGLHAPLPCDAFLWPEGRSYTGGQVVELHTIGSPPLLDWVLEAIFTAGARPAAPGEFTLRAFLSGRIDLTQAEAVLGVIDAQNAADLGAALNQLAGGLARPLDRLRDALLDLLAHLEAGFDFADEDLTFITRDELLDRLADARSQLAAVRRRMASRARPLDVWRAVLVGRPNAGKSSLFNALAGRAAALVADLPGTTRDYLTAELDLDGLKCLLVDTAGIEVESGEWRVERNDSIGREARRVAVAQRRAADVQIWCIASTCPLDDRQREALVQTDTGRRIVVLTKCDGPRRADCEGLATSSFTGEGIAALREELRRQVLLAGQSRGGAVAGTVARCSQSLRLASHNMRRARRVAQAGQEELVAAELRAALAEIGKIVGAVYAEDVLDRVFSRFCIGK